MKYRIAVLSVVVALAGLSSATSVSAASLDQFASRASATSTYQDRTEGNYSPMAATGAPDQSQCGDLGPAWASSSVSTDGVMLTLNFSTVVVPSQIKIWNVIDPRSLVKVEARSGSGSWSVVLARTYSSSLTTGASCLSTPVPHVLDSSNSTLPTSGINQIRLTFNEGESASNAGLLYGGETDAVQLSGTTLSKPSYLVAPSVSGAAKVGKKLAAARGTWTGVPSTVTYTYAWLTCTASGAKSSTKPSDCSYISGATSSTFTLTSAQKGTYIRVRVAATNSASTTYFFSKTTAKVVR